MFIYDSNSIFFFEKHACRKLLKALAPPIHVKFYKSLRYVEHDVVGCRRLDTELLGTDSYIDKVVEIRRKQKVSVTRSLKS
jgi:hypothetical protein